MRVRIAELLQKRRMSPYGLAMASGGRITLSRAYRLAAREGHFATMPAKVLEALCDVLDVEPGELLERDRKR